jgi:glycosyltransferase involved in cell wall biosynthesis
VAAPTRRLGIISVGDPRDPRVWSGCPSALVPALERLGVEVVGIDAGTPGLRRLPWVARYHARRWWHSPTAAKTDLALQRALLSQGYRADFHWDLKLRQHRAHHAVAAARAAELDTVLHLTANALPRQAPSGIRQLAWVDATWRSQTRHRLPGGPARHPSALIAEGDAYEREAFAGVDHMFSMGDWLIADLLAAGIAAADITNVGTGLRNRDADLGHHPEPFRMLTVAKDMEVERGLPAAVAAFRKARSVQPELTLAVAGDPRYPERYGREPGVEAHGFLTAADLDLELDRASLLVNPSTYQTWGQINLEAMNARTPVLGLNRLALPEITERGRLAFLVDDLDEDQIAKAMLEAFSDPGRLRQMGEDGRTSVRSRFSWDVLAATIVDVMDAGPRSG